MFVDDDTRLRVMRDAARKALGLVLGRTPADIERGSLSWDALAWRLTTMREAAAKLTPEGRAALPPAAWSALMQMRDRLAAADASADAVNDGTVDLHTIWQIATTNLPPVVAALDVALEPNATAARQSSARADDTARAPARPCALATVQARLACDHEAIAAFCQRHQIRRLALFGSVLRDDFRPESDVDVLVEFQPDARLSLLDLAGMEIELSALLGRPVDLREPAELNPYFRQQAVDRAEVIYER